MAIKVQDNYLVRCKANPSARLQHFFPSTCIIYFSCSCGKAKAYDPNSKLFPYFKDHLELFKLRLKPTKESSKDWEKYFAEVMDYVSEDPEAHALGWDEL